MDQKAIIIIVALLVLCCCVSSSIGGGFIVFKDPFNWFSNASNTSNTNNVTNGSGGSGGSGILSSATAIQVSEIDTQNISSTTMTNHPTTPTSGPAIFSFMMDVKIDSKDLSWRNIFIHGDEAPGVSDAGKRRPALYVKATDHKLFLSMANQGGTNDDLDIPLTGISEGTYFNLMVVSDGTTIDVYVNRTKVASRTGTYTWTSTDNSTWTWSSRKYTQIRSAPVRIKNFYWWTKALTSSEISSLSPSTTSSYTRFTKQIEPLYDDTYARFAA